MLFRRNGLYYNSDICFYDLIERKSKSKISKIESSGNFGPFNMITKDLLIVGGKNQIIIINVNQYKIIRKINLDNSSWIYGFCKLNENMFLIGDSKGKIRQWKIEGDDNINEISQKNKAHGRLIYSIIKVGYGMIASCSSDKSIKIWGK